MTPIEKIHVEDIVRLGIALYEFLRALEQTPTSSEALAIKACYVLKKHVLEKEEPNETTIN